MVLRYLPSSFSRRVVLASYLLVAELVTFAHVSGISCHVGVALEALRACNNVEVPSVVSLRSLLWLCYLQ